jgi:hypothetical protein
MMSSMLAFMKAFISAFPIQLHGGREGKSRSGLTRTFYVLSMIRDKMTMITMTMIIKTGLLLQTVSHNTGSPYHLHRVLAPNQPFTLALLTCKRSFHEFANGLLRVLCFV